MKPYWQVYRRDNTYRVGHKGWCFMRWWQQCDIRGKGHAFETQSHWEAIQKAHSANNWEWVLVEDIYPATETQKPHRAE